VTGDKSLLQVGNFERIAIITLRDYLSRRKE